MCALSAPLSVRSNGVPINHKPSTTGGHWTTLTGREHEHGRACVGAQMSTNAVFKLQIFVTDFGSNPGAEVQPEWSQQVEWRGVEKDRAKQQCPKNCL